LGQDLKCLLYTICLRTSQLLDLKVGTRQYGDGASAGKKQSKSAKVAETTSGSLGLRLGGMQVYQVQYLITLLTGSVADPYAFGPPDQHPDSLVTSTDPDLSIVNGNGETHSRNRIPPKRFYLDHVDQLTSMPKYVW
jgi:hypothetical protein